MQGPSRLQPLLIHSLPLEDHGIRSRSAQAVCGGHNITSGTFRRRQLRQVSAMDHSAYLLDGYMLAHLRHALFVCTKGCN